MNGASVLGTRSQASRLLEKPSAAEAAVFLLAHTARLEAAPFQSKVRSKQDPVGLYLALLGRASSDRHTSQNRSQDIFHITGGTNVAGASLQRSHPHFFIRDAVRAHDGQSGKFIVQTSDIGQTRGLNVKNYHLRELLCDLGSQLIAGMREIDRMEVRAQSAGQGLGGLRITFQDNNTRTHKSPEHSTVVNGRLRLREGPGKTTTPQTIAISKSRREC